MFNMNNSTLETLRQSPAFEYLDNQALSAMAHLFSILALTNNQPLPIHRGHNEPYLYLVVSGSFNLNLLTPDTPKQVLIKLNPSDLVGGFLSYTHNARETSVTANGKSTVLKILKNDLNNFFSQYEDAFYLFNKTLKTIFYKAQLGTFSLLEFKVSDPHIFDYLKSEIEWKELQNGEVLFKQGDPGDAIFIVLSGRLRSVEQTANGETKLSNIINAGEISGEVAFLTQSNRIATVIAIRDSVVARFSRDGFNKLVEMQPRSMLQVAKLLGHRFKFQMSKKPIRKFGKTLALLPIKDTLSMNDFSAELNSAIQTWGSSICITLSDVANAIGIKSISSDHDTNIHSARVAQWLEQLEFTYDYVLLVADPIWSDWNEKILHYSDHLLLVADAGQSHEHSAIEEKLLSAGQLAKHQNKSLILIHPNSNEPISGTKLWLNNRTIDEWYHIRKNVPDDMRRLARLLTGHANALVLGGGGARGYAHIGVIRALEEQGIPIDRVCGTSVGAIISSGLAIGHDSVNLSLLCKKQFRNLFDYTLPFLSLIRGRRIAKKLNDTFGEQQIEDLLIPFFCISTNLTRAEPVIHEEGSLKSAIRSSMALPAMLPPVYKDGDLIVDGGLLNNLPIDEMRRIAGDCNIIAVDISPKLDLINNEEFSPDISGLKIFYSRINPFKKKIKVPNILQVVERSITVAAVNFGVKIQEQHMADLYIELPVEGVSTFDYDKVDEISNLGYSASVGKIKSWARNLR